MYVRNNVATQDDFAQATTLECDGSIRFNLTVTGAAVYLRTWSGTGGSGQRPDLFLPPGFHTRGWPTSRIAVRSAVAGTPAQVTIEAVQLADDYGG